MPRPSSCDPSVTGAHAKAQAKLFTWTHYAAIVQVCDADVTAFIVATTAPPHIPERDQHGFCDSEARRLYFDCWRAASGDARGAREHASVATAMLVADMAIAGALRRVALQGTRTNILVWRQRGSSCV